MLSISVAHMGENAENSRISIVEMENSRFILKAEYNPCHSLKAIGIQPKAH